MKVILDTNVFISGVFFTGPPSRILKAWHDEKLQLVISQEILEEYERVAEELTAQFPLVNVQQILEMVAVKAERYSPLRLTEPVCDDSDDDKFIACALASKCKIIVSGDKHLLKVSGFRGIKVAKPAEFVDKYLH